MPTIGINVKDTATPMLQRVGRKMPETLNQSMLRAAEQTRGVIVQEVMATYPGGRGGLARSFAPSVLEQKSGKLSIGVYSDLSYAGVQNRGGTIRSSRGNGALAIPIGQGKRLPVGKWPRHFPKGWLTMISRKGKPPLLARVTKKKMTLYFVLKKSVAVKGTHYLDRARRKAQPVVAQTLGQSVSLSVKEAAK